MVHTHFSLLEEFRVFTVFLMAFLGSCNDKGEPAVSLKSTTRHRIEDTIFRSIFNSTKPPIARYMAKTKLKQNSSLLVGLYTSTLGEVTYQMWPDLRKPDTIAHFLISCLLNIYNLHSLMYSLARFQLRMPITLGVTALWSSSNRKFNLYARYWENKLQALTKTMVTYEQKDVLS